MWIFSVAVYSCCMWFFLTETDTGDGTDGQPAVQRLYTWSRFTAGWPLHWTASTEGVWTSQARMSLHNSRNLMTLVSCLSFSLCVSVFMSVCVSIFVCLSVSLCLCLVVFVCLLFCVCMVLCLSSCLSLSICVSLFVSGFLCVLACLFVCMVLCISLSCCISVSLSLFILLYLFSTLIYVVRLTFQLHCIVRPLNTLTIRV